MRDFLVLVGTTFTGCSLFKKNTNDNRAGAAMLQWRAAAKFPSTSDPLSTAIGAADGSPAPHAGATVVERRQRDHPGRQMVDAYHRPVGNAYIRWVNLDEKEAGGPDRRGYRSRWAFHHSWGSGKASTYKLIARTKQGEKMLAGTVLTDAPNVHVVIRIREDW